MKTTFRAYSRAHRKPIGVINSGFIQNPRAVLLLAACRRVKSDRLLGGGRIETGFCAVQAAPATVQTTITLAARRVLIQVNRRVRPADMMDHSEH